MCQITPYKIREFLFLSFYLSFLSSLGSEECASEGSEEVLLACGRGRINYFILSLMQILKLDFVPLAYMWFVVAVDNTLSTFKCLSEKE